MINIDYIYLLDLIILVGLVKFDDVEELTDFGIVDTTFEVAKAFVVEVCDDVVRPSFTCFFGFPSSH
jgi:hypothetical protein